MSRVRPPVQDTGSGSDEKAYLLERPRLLLAMLDIMEKSEHSRTRPVEREEEVKHAS